MKLGEMLGFTTLVDARVKILRTGKSPLDVTWEDIHEARRQEKYQMREKKK